ncbi:MAG: YqgE/AlgH family protein [Pseudomonadota bacterium]
MMRFDEKTSRSGGDGYLDGQMIIAMPGIGDDRFARTVIYLCAHSEEGAMGLVVNRPSEDITFPDLLSQLGVVEGTESIQLPDTVSRMPVHLGGPVETGRGFVLHSSDYHVDNSTLEIDTTISLTATLDVLKAIAHGHGPNQALMALGYAGWSPGQLESEIQSNGWLHMKADREVIFSLPTDLKYDAALDVLGIDPSFLASEAGHA